jgi:hypothetical protein
MAVLITNATVGIRRREFTYDAHGTRVPGALGPVETPMPALVRERGDGGWTLSVDEALWPVREYDVLADADTGQEWLALVIDHLRNEVDDLVNYVRIDARERVAGATEPGGPEFVGRG